MISTDMLPTGQQKNSRPKDLFKGLKLSFLMCFYPISIHVELCTLERHSCNDVRELGCFDAGTRGVELDWHKMEEMEEDEEVLDT